METTKKFHCVINKNLSLCRANMREEKRVATTIKIHYHFTARVDFFWRLLAVKVSRAQHFFMLIQISHVDYFASLLIGWHTSLAFASTSVPIHSISDPEKPAASNNFQRNFLPASESHRSDIKLITARELID